MAEVKADYNNGAENCGKQQGGAESELSSPQIKSHKRTNYLEWPDYFMAVAFLSAQRSKDPSSQVGACIVNEENRIVGIGYNGMPTGCSDDLMPWNREGEDILDTKHAFGTTDLHLKKVSMPFYFPPLQEARGLVKSTRRTRNQFDKHSFSFALGLALRAWQKAQN